MAGLPANPVQTPLPGFLTNPKGDGALLGAARRTIAELADTGLLDDTHALTCQMILQLSAAVDQGLGPYTKVTIATTNMVRQVAELLATLPQPERATTDDWAKLQALLNAEGTP